MKERPILFSGPMVRAILEGRKTLTRRVIQPPPGKVSGELYIWKPKAGNTSYWLTPGTDLAAKTRCPYGQPGDRLWVRETFAWLLQEIEGAPVEPETFLYSADCKPFVGRWVPSIHMPRRASRLTLEVVSVRVEQLQEISAADALAEGCGELKDRMPKEFPADLDKRTEKQRQEWFDGTARAVYIGQCADGESALADYRKLWDAINAKRGFGWNANPWVWVIEFRKCKEEGSCS